MLSRHDLRRWFEASFGSALFWTPVQLFMFLYIPQHCKVAYVAAFSFVHKTWLSWLSNRNARSVEAVDDVELEGRVHPTRDVPEIPIVAPA